MAAQKINIPKLGIFLGGIAALAAGLLAWVSTATAEAIQANLQKKTSTALEQVLPAFDGIGTTIINSAEGWPIKFYIAKKGEKIIGYAGEVITPEGFSGDLTVMAGLNTDGSIRTVIVTANNETPGLGTAVTDRKVQKILANLLKGKKLEAGLPPNAYLDWYGGKKSGSNRWPIVKDGEAINGKTGATITSRAVNGAIFAIGKTCLDHLEQLSKGTE